MYALAKRFSLKSDCILREKLLLTFLKCCARAQRERKNIVPKKNLCIENITIFVRRKKNTNEMISVCQSNKKCANAAAGSALKCNDS